MNGRDSHGLPRPSMVSVYFQDGLRRTRRYVTALHLNDLVKETLILVEDNGFGHYMSSQKLARIEVKPEAETTNDDPHW